MLGGKNILLGITGGIAAYKTTFLVRLFIKAGAEVRVVLTDKAADFVSPLTLATLSKNPVLSSFVREEEGATDWNNHVELGLWADGAAADRRLDFEILGILGRLGKGRAGRREDLSVLGFGLSGVAHRQGQAKRMVHRDAALPAHQATQLPG